jgi:type IV secretion system protein VirB10
VALLFFTASAALTAIAQSASTTQAPPAPQASPGFKQRDDAQPPAGSFSVAPGTRILLNMINSISSKQSQVGDRIYLETAFPIVSDNRIIIPQGSYVTGTVTEVKRPARGRHRGELQVRFDSLTLPNGVTRNFGSDLGAIDARDPLKREHDKVTSSDGNGRAAETVAITTAAGAGLGSSIGVGTGHVLRGVGVGAGAGAAAGMIGVLIARGPDAALNKGSTVEMVLDRSLTFQESELDFSHAPPRAALTEGATRTSQPQRHGRLPGSPW